jgi:membrane-bound metal-dependent hydrolase YbcI (DUF457 family)
MSGAATGLAIAAVLPASLGGPSTITETFIWGGVCAGAALLPDIDLPQSTIARTFSPFSQGISYLTDRACVAFCNVTAGPNDAHRTGGHRTLTHTLLFAVALGAAISALVAAFDKPAIITTLFITLGLALRGLASNWARKEGALVTLAVTAALTWVAWTALPPTGGSTSLGLAITIGCLVHCLGDAITKEGIPLFAPFVPRQGKRWWKLTLPAAVSIRANSPIEKFAIMPALALTSTLIAAHAVPNVSAPFGA